MSALQSRGLRVYTMIRVGTGEYLGEAALCRHCGYTAEMGWNKPTDHQCVPVEAIIPAAEVGPAGGQQGYVYLIRCRELVKIGKSINPLMRIASIASSIPWPVEIIGLIESANHTELESRLHRKYKANRVKGEWFSLKDSDIARISSRHEVLKPEQLK